MATKIGWIVGGIATGTAIILIIANRKRIANWWNSLGSGGSSIDEVLDASGNPVNRWASPSSERCSANCITPYPSGSQYAGYYYCRKNCAHFERTAPIIYPTNTIITQTSHTGGAVGGVGAVGTVGGRG